MRKATMVSMVAVLALTAAACGDSDDETSSGSQDGAPTESTQAPGSSDTTAAEGGSGACVEDATLTITTDAGEVELEAVSAWADVTLDTSATVTIGNYEIAQQDAESIYQPTLSGDDAAVVFYVSATQGATLVPETYVDVATAVGQYQFNNYTVYAPERIFATGFQTVESVVELTEISDTQVCGHIGTAEVSGDFVADRI